MIQEEQEDGLFMERELAISLSQCCFQDALKKEREVVWLLLKSLKE